MARTMDDLKSKLRRQLGSPSTDEYSEPQIGEDLTSAINEYSKYKPDQVFDTITTVAKQPTYDLSTKARIKDVIEVFYSVNIEWEFDKYWPLSIDIGRLAGISLFENPSIWTQYVMRLKQYKMVFECTYDYNPISQILTLIPNPDWVKIVPFIYTRLHTAATIPEDDIDTMFLWAKALAKESWATPTSANRAKREILSVSGFGISTSVGGVSAADLIKQADKHKTEFERKLGARGSVISIG